MESAGPSFFDTEFGEINALCLKYLGSLHTNTSYPVFVSCPIFHTHHTYILLTINLYEKCHLYYCTLPLWLWQTAPRPTFLYPVSSNVSRSILNRDVLSSKDRGVLFSWFQLHTKFWDYKKIYDLIAQVSPTTSGLKLFFLFNKQNAVFHSSFQRSCGNLNALSVAFTSMLCCF